MRREEKEHDFLLIALPLIGLAYLIGWLLSDLSDLSDLEPIETKEVSNDARQ